ncbi:MAG: hypothetical protein GY845_39300 [Planctomycetes bacterium]|nr:hypothetical protein [Planctomycetota bacterium]
MDQEIKGGYKDIQLVPCCSILFSLMLKGKPRDNLETTHKWCVENMNKTSLKVKKEFIEMAEREGYEVLGNTKEIILQ